MSLTIYMFYVDWAALEKESKLARKQKKSMPEPDVKYCIYMMEKYGEDYKVSYL